MCFSFGCVCFCLLFLVFLHSAHISPISFSLSVCSNLHEFVRHVARQTNMRILTPIEALPPTVSFLAANLYARSVFGEDALVNVSVENRPDGTIKGHMRIRAKTQGVALSLGDRITAKQKVGP
jgi:coatomer subunit beta